MPVTVTSSSIDFRFPDVHEDATLSVLLHRTLRVPDDGTRYGLPPALGLFDVRSAQFVDIGRPPSASDARHAVMPMWQSEACFVSFSSRSKFPFLVKIGAGSINAVTGEQWSPIPDFGSEDYVEVPNQPWLDGFCVDEDTVRQFVAMPLGDGFTVEEQLSDNPAQGGIQIAVYPIKRDVWDERLRLAPPMAFECCIEPSGDGDMGFGAGGSIKQSIATPIEPTDNWDLETGATAYVQMVNSTEWQSMTGCEPPTTPFTISDYEEYRFPWYQWYDDSLARQGSAALAGVKTVKQVGDSIGQQSLPDNGSFTPPVPIVVGP